MHLQYINFAQIEVWKERYRSLEVRYKVLLASIGESQSNGEIMHAAVLLQYTELHTYAAKHNLYSLSVYYWINGLYRDSWPEPAPNDAVVHISFSNLKLQRRKQ